MMLPKLPLQGFYGAGMVLSALAVFALGPASAADAVVEVEAQALVIAQAAPPAAPSAKGKARAPTEQGTDGTMQRRLEQLEEQFVDMQVTIGTLESLAKSGGGGARTSGSAVGGGFGASDAARLEGMETQIRALSSEVQRLTAQVRQLSGGSDRGDAGSNGAGQSGSSVAAAPAASYRSSFGSTTVTPGGGGDAIGGLIDGRPVNSAPPESRGRDTEVAALPSSNGDAKQDYETAYGHLLRQDYGAAEAAFEEFLKNHPGDALAGNAQYWLGETHFVRGAYKPAAGAFLKGYQNYGKSNKAPDSLLKLAMSLDRLGQKDAACSSYGELTTRFPDAPAHVRNSAAAEKRRLGCR